MLLDHGANPNVEDSQGNTPLHILCLEATKEIQKRFGKTVPSPTSTLKCASHLLKAGAGFSKNVQGVEPQIEVFFTEENEDQITEELVDGLVKRVQANQLGKQQALKLLMPKNTTRRVLFQLAQGSSWKAIAKWASESNIDLKNIIPRLSNHELEKMVAVAREGQWGKKQVHALLCEEDDEGIVMLSTLQQKSQQEVAFWDQKGTNQVAHKMSKDFLHWLLQEVREKRWDGGSLGEAFCQLNSENKLKLLTVDEESQREIANLNPTSICHSAPLLGSKMQMWVFQEAVAGRWDQDQVFQVLEEKEDEEGTAVCAKMTNLGDIHDNKHPG